MSGNDYVKFMTQEIVKYMDTPQEERKKRKSGRKHEPDDVSDQWLGLIPFAFRLLIKRKK
ncbi:YqzE family protein [Sediminibacillus albus]|uniref:YqzE-like protein n=1 Tax=Sediminibacillus albus TaxID=407036 RepID=A0A1G9CU77_9BACI|nr:YqzE family protein [Sediminibacillus albus]SDK55261.1 YqzE-like protein [Sediminibacillus albus]